MLMRSLCLGLAFLVVGSASCARPWAYQANLNSDDVNERILAIRQAGEQKDRAAVPILVNRLEDEDDAVRFFAIIALQRITGQRFGYEYSQPLAIRTKSVEIWREYLKSPDRALSMEREGHSGRGVTNATSNQGL
jgi:HEAT repeats